MRRRERRPDRTEASAGKRCNPRYICRSYPSRRRLPDIESTRHHRGRARMRPRRCRPQTKLHPAACQIRRVPSVADASGTSLPVVAEADALRANGRRSKEPSIEITEKPSPWDRGVWHTRSSPRSAAPPDAERCLPGCGHVLSPAWRVH